MDRIEIVTAEDRRQFLPGEHLGGTVRWQLSDPPEAVEVRLVWFTDGRGDRDADVVDVVRYDGLPKSGEKDFAIELPHAPYSFSGKLITLTWALEAVVLPGETAERVELEIGPDGRAVDLYATG